MTWQQTRNNRWKPEQNVRVVSGEGGTLRAFHPIKNTFSMKMFSQNLMAIVHFRYNVVRSSFVSVIMRLIVTCSQQLPFKRHLTADNVIFRFISCRFYYGLIAFTADIMQLKSQFVFFSDLLRISEKRALDLYLVLFLLWTKCYKCIITPTNNHHIHARC